MGDDLLSILTRFHQGVVLPDLDQRLGQVREETSALRREMLAHFDEMYRRFDRLETEYQALAAAVARLEARSVTRAEFNEEVEGLRARVKELERRIAQLQTES